MHFMHVSTGALPALANQAAPDARPHEDIVSKLINMLSENVVAFNHRVRRNCLSEVQSTALITQACKACDAISDGLDDATKQQK